MKVTRHFALGSLRERGEKVGYQRLIPELVQKDKMN